MVPKRLWFSYSVGDQGVQRQAATGDSVGHLWSSSLKVMDGVMDRKTGVQGDGRKLNLTDNASPPLQAGPSSKAAAVEVVAESGDHSGWWK